MITTEQRAEVIAIYDGWLLDSETKEYKIYYQKLGKDFYCVKYLHKELYTLSNQGLNGLYLTDLKFLATVAVKLQKEGTIYCQQFHYDTPEYHYFSALVNKITIEYNNLEKDENNCYSKLFDACYDMAYTLNYSKNQKA